MKKCTLLFVIITLFANSLVAQNLITNGNFETSGGFTSNYNLYGGSTSSPKSYAIIGTPLSMNPNYTNTCVDHTTGLGKMMVVDGSNSAGDKIWEQVPGGGIPVVSGTVYTFSYWIQSVSATNAIGNLADIEVRINNTILIPTTGSTICPATLCSWTKVVYTWTATTNYAQIWLYDKQTSSVGNDFALDDITLMAAPTPLTASYSYNNSSCIGANNGSIVIYGIGGSGTYTSYSISGASSQTNTSGMFTNLAPGTYTISITDSTPTTITQSGIVITDPFNPLIVSSNAAICAGGSTTLSVSGGSTYTWTASPADATLTTPNSATPLVSPITTTTYTVSSPISTTKNLVFNGDFFLGNAGFVTDYQYLSSAPAAGVQKAYGIVSNPSTWFSPFSTCGDHTNGTGNMMVIDGSTSNSGTDKIWSQTIPVIAGQNYTFSYWIQSLTNTNFASINTKINGVSLGSGLAPSVITCGNWTQYTYTWNSGASTIAQISLYDTTVIASGNDFALDDISFTTLNTCIYSKSAIITVNPLPVVTINNPILCTGANAIVTASPAIPGTYNYVWTVPSGVTNPGNVSSFPTSIDGVYSVVITNTVTNCSSISASGTYTKPTVTISSNFKGCSSQLTANSGALGFGNYNYTWTVPSGATNPGNVFSFVATVSGTYTVVITNTITGCISNVASINLVFPVLSINTVSNVTVCNGDTIFSTLFTSNIIDPNIIYTWTNSNPLLGIGPSGTGNIPNILATNNTSTPLISTISVIATLLGCQNSLPITFTIKINPTPKVTVNDIVKCTGDNSPDVVVATPNVAGNYTYTWTVPAGITNPGNVPSFTPVDPCLVTCNGTCVKSYSVTITDNVTNCVSASATGTVGHYINCSTAPIPPKCPNGDIKIEPTETLCNNSSCTTLTASFEDERATTSYSVKCIPYVQIVPSASATSGPLCTIDDTFSDPQTLPFTFSFFGSCYNQFQVLYRCFLFRFLT